MIKKRLLNTNLVRPIWDKQEYRSLERIWLDKNECSDPDMQNIVFDALSKVTVNEIYSYPNLDNLYKKLENFVGVSSDNLLITNGSDGAIRSCFEATIEPGDKIVLTRPTFAMYDVYSKIYGADVSWLDYSATPDGPYLDIKQIIRIIKDNLNRNLSILFKKELVNNILIPIFLKKDYFKLIKKKNNLLRYSINLSNNSHEIENIF